MLSIIPSISYVYIGGTPGEIIFSAPPLSACPLTLLSWDSTSSKRKQFLDHRVDMDLEFGLGRPLGVYCKDRERLFPIEGTPVKHISIGPYVLCHSPTFI